MKKSITGVIWGLLFIALGVMFAMRAFGFSVHIFFDGWWTMFIIIPSFIGLFERNNRSSSLIGLGIGFLLLLAARDFIGWGDFGKFAIAFIFVIIGMSLLFRRSHHQEQIRQDYIPRQSGSNNYSAIFSGRSVQLDNEEFTGANISAAFGSVQLDLRNAYFSGDTVIEAMCALGGIDIYVPNDIKVVVNCMPILGGVDNKTRNPEMREGMQPPTLYINGTCILGGIDIK